MTGDLHHGRSRGAPLHRARPADDRSRWRHRRRCFPSLPWPSGARSARGERAR